MEVLTALLVILASILGYLVYCARKINKYWEERGIPHEKPSLFLGNSWSGISGRESMMFEWKNKLYKKYPNAPLIGYYDLMRPILIVKDLDLVQRVFIKDFKHFAKRVLEPDEVNFPHLENLSVMTGKRWKSLRNKMIPVFTTGKLRQMYGQMSELGESLVNKIDTQVENKNGVELKLCFDCYSMDIIGSTAFGLDIGSMRDGDNEFARMGKKVFDWVFNLRFLLMNNFPVICKKFGVGMNRPSVFKYFTGIVQQTFEHRRRTGGQRNDFVNLMIQLKEKGHLDLVKDEVDEGSDDYLMMTDDSIAGNERVEITEPLILANAFLFIMAGFDTAGTLLTMLCLDLSQNIAIQNKLREDLRKALVANKGVFCYEVIRDTPYLEMCIKESMRLHTLIPMMLRICTKEYTFPGTNITVKPGDSIEIPSNSIHMDPEIYPDPENFNPERFAPDVSRPNCTWIPFGEGPRICIAMRFVITEVKCAIAKVLLKYELALSPRTELPLRPSPRSLIYKPKQHIYFNLKKIS